MNNKIIHEDAQRVVERVDFNCLRNKTVMVTGATGLLGTHFLATLATIKPYLNLTVNAVCHSMPADYTEEICYQGGLNIQSNEYELPAADVIIHAAGYAQPSVFTSQPVQTLLINTSMVHELLGYMKPGGKFLFLSSSEVYSGLGGLVTETSIGNTTPSHPRACYIEGKRCGETIVNAYRNNGINAKSARLSLAYGPGTRKHDQRAMSQFIEQALTEGEIKLKYSGREPRTFCYISDAVESLWNVLLHGKEAVYNVGGESVTNMAGVAAEVSRLTDAKLSIPQDEAVMPGAPLVVSMDLSRIKNEFGKRDFVSLEDGLKRTVEWQKGLYGRL
jgi:UDP-glucuronate decarboxylase